MFRLIMRHCSFFNNSLTLKCLYTTLVRSFLEYATLIWDSGSIGISNEIEAVQYKFLRFISFKLNIVRVPHSGHCNILKFIHTLS